MTSHRSFGPFLIHTHRNRRFARGVSFSHIAVLAALYFPALQVALSQEPSIAVVTSALGETKPGTTKEISDRRPVESDLSVMGTIPDGDYRMFSATVRCTAWTVGVEYDRHWFHLLGSRADYVAEVLPLVFLSQPAVSDFWGNAKSPNQQTVPGISLSPFGFRFLWRGTKAVKPFAVGKVGAIAFTKKAFSPNASYANVNVQAAFGFQIRMTQRVDLRVEPFEFFHVSNAYLAASNPGMDQLSTRIGVTYHLGKQER